MAKTFYHNYYSGLSPAKIGWLKIISILIRVLWLTKENEVVTPD